MDFVTKAADDDESVDIFYLDFAKAFDKVPRQRKLIAKGVDANIVRWIENWLTGRTQRVCIQGQQSEDSDVDSGVPQGTVLGPTLFTVYIDDLEVEVVAENLDVIIVKFADDTKGAKVIRGEEDRQKLQQALDIFCEWANKWGMSFNVGKCKIMHVGRNNPGLAYSMNGTQVGTTDEERDIGVVISKSLKPASQCNIAAGRATTVLNQIRRNFHYRDRHKGRTQGGCTGCTCIPPPPPPPVYPPPRPCASPSPPQPERLVVRKDEAVGNKKKM
jgi:ribonuclease P/MRP protein subunit RPP40